jgi:hypothetical protein
MEPLGNPVLVVLAQRLPLQAQALPMRAAVEAAVSEELVARQQMVALAVRVVAVLEELQTVKLEQQEQQTLVAAAAAALLIIQMALVVQAVPAS